MDFVPNYDESRIPAYTLPELFPAGTTAQEWLQKYRPQWLKKLADIQFGAIPPPPASTAAELLDSVEIADGAGIRRQYRLVFRGWNSKTHPLDVTVYLPANKQPAPAFCMLNFQGAHTLENDPRIPLPDYWTHGFGQPTPVPRGSKVHRFPIQEILKRGYAVVTACYCQLYPDNSCDADSAASSIYTLSEADVKGQKPSISAWAWGYSRLADFASTLPEINPDKLCCLGHSRLGKSALWAGANDERFKVVVSNCSGQGGAALNRRLFGETFNAFFYPKANVGYWFSPVIKEYMDNINTLPFDAHCLLACVAPRGLCVGSATEDLWADPKGERMSLLAAEDAWRLFGNELPTDSPETPEPDAQRVTKVTENHLRIGKHDLLIYDWVRYMDFADQFLA